METKKEKQQVARRDLLKIAGLGGVVGAAAIATSAGEAEAAAEINTKGSGYRETEHVRTYYDLAKF